MRSRLGPPRSTLPLPDRLSLELDTHLPQEALDPDLVPHDQVERLFPLLRLVLWTGYKLGRRDTKGELERRILE